MSPAARRLGVGVSLLVAAAAVTAGVFFYNSKQRQIPVIFSDREMLDNVWASYKKEYIEPGTVRTLDKQRDNVSTSEGQSYTMLRAVWEDDKPTFDASWQWTKDNLGHDDQQDPDALFSWLFGKRADGSYGIITDQGGQNTAADGDTDIALALLMAEGRWGGGAYRAQAEPIIADIWKYEVVDVAGAPVLVSNNLERKATGTVLVNPSYFSPYAYRAFAAADPAHDWNAVAASSYDILNRSTSEGIAGATGTGLPPNWLAMDRATGDLAVPADTALTADYGYDAMRIPWRIALDYSWNGSTAAREYLSSLSLLGTKWRSDGKLVAVYHRDGTAGADYESPSMYGASLGYFLVADPDAAGQVYREKLQVLYSADRQGWTSTLSYYDDNWAWFGLALASGQLPNLTDL